VEVMKRTLRDWILEHDAKKQKQEHIDEITSLEEAKAKIRLFNQLCIEMREYMKEDAPKEKFIERQEMILHTNTLTVVNQELTREVSDEITDTDIVINETPLVACTTSTTTTNSKEQLILREVFKMADFRNNQKSIIEATLAQKDVFVVMPTGAGKSLTYQLPAICSNGVTIVISPLLSLIRDQVLYLKSLNVKAEMLTSDQTGTMNNNIVDSLLNNVLKIIYVTPERIVCNQGFNQILHTLHTKNLIARIVIDEAHCISKWGHEFRPDYRKLSDLQNVYPGVPIMALTATATQLVFEDIKQQLSLKEPAVFRSSFNRPNLFYSVVAKDTFTKTAKDISDFINTKHHNETGIVYCLSKKGCEKVSEELNRLGHATRPYHADLGMNEKQKNHVDWKNGTVKIMVATVAFGMGIDKPDVRFVIHHSFPKTIEDYYQETGRAGRDGNPSDCRLYYSAKDRTKNYSLINSGVESEHRDSLVTGLNKMVAFCESLECRRCFLLNHFDETFDSKNCNNLCDNCRSGKQVESTDITQHAINFLNIVKSTGNRETMKYLISVWKGSMAKKVKNNGHDKLSQHGSARNLPNEYAERITSLLIQRGYLKETLKTSQYASFCTISITPEAKKVLDGEKLISIDRIQIVRPVRTSPATKQAHVPKFKPLDPSTSNISTPTQLYPIKQPEIAEQPSVIAPTFRGFKPIPLPTKFSKPITGTISAAGPISEPVVTVANNSQPITQLPTPPPSSSQFTSANSSAPHPDIVPLLKSLRKQLAKTYQMGTELNVYNDVTLQVLATTLPVTMEELESISGISKYAKFMCGKQIIEEIQSFKECLPKVKATVTTTQQTADFDYDEDHELMEMMNTNN
jgi:bloom syndrome protein